MGKEEGYMWWGGVNKLNMGVYNLTDVVDNKRYLHMITVFQKKKTQEY